MPLFKQTSMNVRLLEAAWLGDVGEIDRTLRYGANVNVRARSQHHRGQTPLHRLFNNAGVDTLALHACTERLLAAGADPNKVDAHGQTPAMALLGTHHDTDVQKVMPALLAHGMRCGGTASTAPPPVFLLGNQRGHIALLDQVLTHGGNLEERNAQQDTPLLAHVRRLHQRSMSRVWWDVLKNHGADVNAVSRLDGASPLTLVAQTLENQPQNVAWLVDLLDQGAKPDHAQRLMVPGSSGGQMSHAFPAVEHRDRPMGEGYTALHFAAWYGAVEACAALIEHGAPVTARTSNRGLPVYRGSFDRLVEPGPGYTARELALLVDHPAVANLLEGAELRHAMDPTTVGLARPRSRL